MFKTQFTNKYAAEQANRTFSALLRTEVFGGDIPPAPVFASDAQKASPVNTTAFGGALQSDLRISSINNSNNDTITFNNIIIPKTPPRSSNSLPSTPHSSTSRNLFSFASPSKRSSFSQSSSNATSAEKPTSEHYSLSPVRSDSQALLLSPRKQPRAIPKVPFKVLDAPELQDDFYLNLVDWGSSNILGVGLGNAVYLWYSQSGWVQKLCEVPPSDGVTSVSWIGRGTHVAIGTGSGSVMIWDTERLKKVRTMTGHHARVGALAWNEHVLTSGSRDRSILHRDVRVPEHYFRRLTSHKQEVCGLKWNVEDNQLASGGNDNKLFVWDKCESTPLYKFSDHCAAVKAISWNPHQRGILASGGGTADRKIKFWNTMTGERLQDIDTGSQVCNLAWSKNSNELISTHGYSQNQVVLWKYPSMNQVAALTGHTYRVLYLAMSPDGQTVVTGAGDETLRFWNVFGKGKGTLKSSPFLFDTQQIR